MFYKLIERKRDIWLNSANCSVKELIEYIETKGKMRDAQIEAIKTFLFLKLHCKNRPLWELFYQGEFVCEETIKTVRAIPSSYDFLRNTPAAVALLEYSRLHNKDGNAISNDLEKEILDHAEQIDYNKAFLNLFYGISYADYLFSLPMGAGKTFLMAAIIYIELYFANEENNKQNPLFAHNFMILIPSGKKTSILPSLKNIIEFDPSWVLPEEYVAKIRGLVKFEILDEATSAKGSNMVKNPNAQKINQHLSRDGEELIGLVAFTNAEKVILNRTEKPSLELKLFDEERWRRENEGYDEANELRGIIGKIPNLAIFTDEEHHIANENIKLRGVVTEWAESGNFKYMLGFSGTPYYESAKPVEIGPITVRNTDLSNVVYHYPLKDAIGNFLKHPDIKKANGDSEDIIRIGLTEFLEKYSTKVYANGTFAKLAIYCTSIDKMMKEVYPQVVTICASFGLSSDIIFPYHGGNDNYKISKEDDREFALLDTPISKKRIILLVGIGAEGWDCKSLTGVIMSQKETSTKISVLQKSCRCLREVIRGGEEEHALIWLNEWNYAKLDDEIQKSQNTSIKDLVISNGRSQKVVNRYSRIGKLKLPPVYFYQMNLERTSEIVETRSLTRDILSSDEIIEKEVHEVMEMGINGDIKNRYDEVRKNNNHVTFNQWIHLIEKEGFNMTKIVEMLPYIDLLKAIFNKVTEERNGIRYYREDVKQQKLRSNIRLAFIPKKIYHQKKKVELVKASLLAVEDSIFQKPKPVDDLSKYYPTQEDVQQINYYDSLTKEEIDDEHRIAINKRNKGLNVPDPLCDLTERDFSYHYLPYKFDSDLENRFFSKLAIKKDIIREKNLEVFFNGDDELTEFKISCFKELPNGQWEDIGGYVPDFLIMQRDSEGKPQKILIIETKGDGYELNFAQKKEFMDGEFQKMNNNHSELPDFSFLYLSEKLESKHSEMLTESINVFFK